MCICQIPLISSVPGRPPSLGRKGRGSWCPSLEFWAPDPALKRSVRLPRAWRDPAGCPHTLTGPGPQPWHPLKCSRTPTRRCRLCGQGSWVGSGFFIHLCNFRQVILHLCASSFSSRKGGGGRGHSPRIMTDSIQFFTLFIIKVIGPRVSPIRRVPVL